MKKYIALLFAFLSAISLFTACGTDTEDDLTVSSSDPDNVISEENSPDEEVAPTSDKIEMPYSSADYCGADWTLESLTAHLKELGFTAIETVPCVPDNDKYEANIFEIYIETGLFSTDPWEAGEKYDPDDEITIYYNEFPLLTVENCPDLLTVLTSRDIDYMTFANKYDGRYVEFNAYVTSHTTYDGGTSYIINVTGGDYNGETELGNYDAEYYDGLIIRIGDRTWRNNINESVEEGDNVFVSGKIDASWCEYYKMLYVECRDLSIR